MANRFDQVWFVDNGSAKNVTRHRRICQVRHTNNDVMFYFHQEEEKRIASVMARKEEEKKKEISKLAVLKVVFQWTLPRFWFCELWHHYLMVWLCSFRKSVALLSTMHSGNGRWLELRKCKYCCVYYCNEILLILQAFSGLSSLVVNIFHHYYFIFFFCSAKTVSRDALETVPQTSSNEPPDYIE